MKGIKWKKKLGLGVFVLHCIGGISPTIVYAEIHISDLPRSESKENSIQHPLRMNSMKLNTTDAIESESYDELVPYIIPSPDQEDAGSCLYMAITGIAEWWLARLNPHLSRASDGPLDLSERYVMNVAGVEEEDTALENWRTDAVYLFNRNKNYSLLNSEYRYTKGWFIGDAYSDHLLPAARGVVGAEYGTQYNWIDQRPTVPQQKIQLPVFERDVLFADSGRNQWNVGVAPFDIVDRVKEALRTRKSPVLVIYNQNSYWHAVFLVGYNDSIDNGNCAYTEKFRKVILERADELAKKAAEATDPKVKQAYEIRAQRAKEAKAKIEQAYATQGGCHSRKGVFYIRDSIYPNEQGPLYDYDLKEKGEEAPYSKNVVYKEYDWLRYFANHISVIYPAQGDLAL